MKISISSKVNFYFSFLFHLNFHHHHHHHHHLDYHRCVWKQEIKKIRLLFYPFFCSFINMMMKFHSVIWMKMSFDSKFTTSSSSSSWQLLFGSIPLSIKSINRSNDDQMENFFFLLAIDKQQQKHWRQWWMNEEILMFFFGHKCDIFFSWWQIKYI